MPNQSAVLDQVFHVLANATRRDVLEALGKGPASMTELAEPHSMALPSLMQHLNLMEELGLVSSTKIGRVRTYELTPQRLNYAEDWLASQRTLWTTRLDQLDRFLITLKDQQP